MIMNYEYYNLLILASLVGCLWGKCRLLNKKLKVLTDKVICLSNGVDSFHREARSVQQSLQDICDAAPRMQRLQKTVDNLSKEVTDELEIMKHKIQQNRHEIAKMSQIYSAK